MTDTDGAALLAAYRTRLVSEENLDAGTEPELPAAEQALLSALVAAGDLPALVAVADLIFEQALARFEAVSPWITDSRQPRPTEAQRQPLARSLRDGMHLAGRGLGWVSTAARAAPQAAPQLGQALGRTDRLFWGIRWLDVASGTETLGFSQSFTDASSGLCSDRNTIRARLADPSS